MAFVYWIRHKDHTDITTEGYIGFTSKTVDVRFSQHKMDCKLSNKVKGHVHKAIVKYGDDIVVQTLIECETEYGLDIEKKLRPTKNIGWNLAVGGRGGSRGHTHTPEARVKISKGNKGRTLSPEACAEISKRSLGRKHTPETCKKMSEAKKDWKPSIELRKIVSENMSGKKKSQSAINARSSTIEQEPWRGSPAKNRVLWANADEIFSRLQGGESISHIPLSFGFGRSSIATMSSKFKEGWIPSEDTLWCAYRDSEESFVFSSEQRQEMRAWKPDLKPKCPDWQNHAANKSVWAIASVLFTFFLQNPDTNSTRVSKVFGGLESNFTKIIKKLKSGWIPSEDIAYQTWLTEYKLKEAANVP